MDRKSMLGTVFTLVILVAAGSLAAFVGTDTNPVPGATQTLQPQSPSTQQVAFSDNPRAESAASLATESSACSRCPDGSPSCWSNKQCDSYCGGKGLGQCVQINSCYRCCYCAAR